MQCITYCYLTNYCKARSLYCPKLPRQTDTLSLFERFISCPNSEGGFKGKGNGLAGRGGAEVFKMESFLNLSLSCLLGNSWHSTSQQRYWVGVGWSVRRATQRFWEAGQRPQPRGLLGIQAAVGVHPAFAFAPLPLHLKASVASNICPTTELPPGTGVDVVLMDSRSQSGCKPMRTTREKGKHQRGAPHRVNTAGRTQRMDEGEANENPLLTVEKNTF